MGSSQQVMLAQAIAAGGPATFSDDFNTGSVLSGSWTATTGTWAIVSQKAAGSAAATEHLAVVNSVTFANNQKSSAKLGTFGGDQDPGVVLRGNTSNTACYFFCWNNNQGRFEAYRVSSGLGYTSMANSATSYSPVAGDAFSFEVTSSAFIGKYGATQVLSFSDSTIASGRPGIRAYGTSSLDDFSATDI